MYLYCLNIFFLFQTGVLMIVDRVKHIFKLAQVRCRDFTKGLTIAVFHMASLKFKVKKL